MIEQMPAMDVPDWLKEAASDKGFFSVEDVLKDSLYYPACGFDGTPVKYLCGNIHSFIYVDYGVSRNSFLECIDGSSRRCGFSGYSAVRLVDLQMSDFVSPGWRPPVYPDSSRDLNRLKYREKECEPFAHWSIWKREDDFPSEHGPELFSFLYIAAEMSAAYQALYYFNKVKPKVIAVIQPGCFGGEWESVPNNESFFIHVVRKNPEGMPEYLLYGGSIGRRNSWYDEACWREYEGDRLHQLPQRSAGLWKLRSYTLPC